MKTTILFTNCVHRSRFVLLLVSLLIGCFVVFEAVLPAPDGGYPGANTAEGQSALSSLTTGVHNTALGFQALFRNTTGNTNTASGSQALLNNTPELGTPLPGFRRSLVTLPASATRQMERSLFLAIPTAMATRPMDKAPLLVTPVAAPIRPRYRCARKQHDRRRQHGRRGCSIEWRIVRPANGE
jgi:hypothetical protein